MNVGNTVIGKGYKEPEFKVHPMFRKAKSSDLCARCGHHISDHSHPSLEQGTPCCLEGCNCEEFE